MSVLIKDCTILTQNDRRQQLHGNIYIEDQNVVQISKKSIPIEADYKIDGRKKLVLPGLINTHTHIPMTLLRGYGDDMVLHRSSHFYGRINYLYDSYRDFCYYPN